MLVPLNLRVGCDCWSESVALLYSTEWLRKIVIIHIKAVTKNREHHNLMVKVIAADSKKH